MRNQNNQIHWLGVTINVVQIDLYWVDAKETRYSWLEPTKFKRLSDSP